MEAELTQMVGANVFQRLLAYLRQRDRLRAQRVALPHPAVRYPKPVAATGFSSVEDQFEQKVSDQAPSPAALSEPSASAPASTGPESPDDAALLPE
jgi:hypothetical protein